ncbi:DMT family transporter [Lysinimonas soli]|uniref:DMT family transporter n=1 Tax=Lysinimonas soli TaxID=1074233 RepID=A0ABW0NNR0_9MICO
MGYLYALLGALLFGANGSMTKLLVEGGLSATQLTLFRTMGTAVLAGIVLLLTDRSGFRMRPRQLLVMAVLGVAGVALLQASYASALALLPVGIALLLEYTAVLLVALVAFFVFREKVKARLWVAIACVLVGLAIVARIWASDLNPLGVVLALVAAITLTLYFVVGERQVSATSPLAVAFWTGLFAGAFWAVFSGWWQLDPSVLGKPVPLGGSHGAFELPLVLPLAATVVFGSFLPFLLSFSALKHLSATAAGIVASSEVLFAFLVAWLWLGEGLDPVQIVGAAIVLVGIVLAQTARAGKVVDADLALPGVGAEARR